MGGYFWSIFTQIQLLFRSELNVLGCPFCCLAGTLLLSSGVHGPQLQSVLSAQSMGQRQPDSFKLAAACRMSIAVVAWKPRSLSGSAAASCSSSFFVGIRCMLQVACVCRVLVCLLHRPYAGRGLFVVQWRACRHTYIQGCLSACDTKPKAHAGVCAVCSSRHCCYRAQQLRLEQTHIGSGSEQPSRCTNNT